MWLWKIGGSGGAPPLGLSYLYLEGGGVAVERRMVADLEPNGRRRHRDRRRQPSVGGEEEEDGVYCIYNFT